MAEKKTKSTTTKKAKVVKAKKETVVPKSSAKKETVAPKSSAKKETVIPARLLGHYRKNIIPQLMKTFDYKNVMKVPKLEKIVVNMGPFYGSSSG